MIKCADGVSQQNKPCCGAPLVTCLAPLVTVGGASGLFWAREPHVGEYSLPLLPRLLFPEPIHLF